MTNSQHSEFWWHLNPETGGVAIFRTNGTATTSDDTLVGFGKVSGNTRDEIIKNFNELTSQSFNGGLGTDNLSDYHDVSELNIPYTRVVSDKPESSDISLSQDSKSNDHSEPLNTNKTNAESPSNEESKTSKYGGVKESFDNARKADELGDTELAQKYRALAWDSFHQVQSEDSKAGVAVLGAAIATPFVAAAGIAGGIAAASTAAGEAVLGLLAKRSVQWSLTGIGIATGVKSDEDADISSVVLEGALRGILPLLSKSLKGPGPYGTLAEEPLKETDDLINALNQGELGDGIEDLGEISKLWSPIAERMRTLAVIKTDKGLYYAVRGGTLTKEQIRILESFGFKSAKEELKNLGLGVLAKEGHAERQLIDLALTKGEAPQTLLISKAACGRTCHYCSQVINDFVRDFGYTPNEFHPSGKAVSFRSIEY